MRTRFRRGDPTLWYKVDAANMTRAAALGLERSHLYRKMKSLGISPADP